MRVQLITPTRRSRKGNWVHARRWARILRQLGCTVTVGQELGGACDLLVALHARKSFDAIAAYRRRSPHGPLIVSLTGTDVYRDMEHDGRVHQALQWAHRIVVLQPRASDLLATELRPKTRLIRQSAVPTAASVAKSRRHFDVCVIGHLRPVKDPFRAAAAARRLPAASRLRIVHAGGALSPDMAQQAKREMATNRRYRWLGNRPPWQVRRLMARSHAMVLSSQMEGGANVVSEALVSHLAIIASRISGTLGMLGDDHPGYFEVGDTAALAELLRRCEQDGPWLRRLTAWSRRLAPLYRPEIEIEAWRRLLGEFWNS